MLWDGDENNLDEELSRSRKNLLYLCTPGELYPVKWKWWQAVSFSGLVSFWVVKALLCHSEKSTPSVDETVRFTACPFSSFLRVCESCYATCFSNPVCDSLHCNCYFCCNKLRCCLSRYRYWRDASNVEVIKIKFTHTSNRKYWADLWVKMQGGNVFW